MQQLFKLAYIVLILILIYVGSVYYQIIFGKYGVDKVGGISGRYNGGKDIKEKFQASLNYSMGPYSNVRLQNTGEYWMQPPQNAPLKDGNLYTPTGTPFPLRPNLSGPAPMTNGPNVDGTKNTPPSMFSFAYNQFKPECCPSIYSSDNGCVCTTANQRKLFSKRGNNKTSPSEI